MKRIDIEALVQWAYRDELPKVAAGTATFAAVMKPAWDCIAKLGTLGTIIQENRYGVVALPCASDEPHPDALAVADAVARLDALVFDIPEGWAPLSDMGDLGALGASAVAQGLASLTTTDETGATRLRRPLSRLVIRQAVLGIAPEWRSEVPEVREVRRFGRPAWFRRAERTEEGAFGPASYEVEVDGFDYKRRRPYADAYRKYVLEPDMAPLVTARAEHELWQGALSVLAEDLAEAGLTAHEVLPPSCPARPWEVAARDAPRILPSLLAPSPIPRATRRKKNSIAA